MQMTSCPCLRKLSQRCEPMKPAPPVIKYLAMIASYRIVFESQFSQVRRIVNVSAVKNDRRLEQLLDALKIGPPKFVPLRENQQSRRPFQSVIIAGGVTDSIAKNFLRFRYRFRIKCLDLSARLQKRFDDGNRGCVPHVVGARLERQPPDREGQARKVRAKMTPYLVDQCCLLPLVHLLHGLQQKHLRSLSAHADHRPDILGETRASIADPGKDEMGADAPIQGNRTPHFRYIGAHLLAET